MLDKEKIKQSLTEEDIRLILKDLGSAEPKNDKQGNLLFETVCHGGDSHKLYYHPEGKTFHCYTHCQETFDVYELIIRAKKNDGYYLSFYETVKYVASITGKHFGKNQQINSYIIDDWKWINKFKRKKKVNTQLPTYDEKVLGLFLPYPHEDWLNEGISRETLQKFNVGYYLKREQITIPHYNTDKQLVGIRGRAMRQEDIDAGKKYMPVIVENKIYSFPTNFNLYGLHKTKEAIKRLKKVAIFEGEKSVYKCEDYYGEDNFACATGGGKVSKFHRDIVLGLGVEEVFICKDKEFTESESEEAYKYAEDLREIAQLFTPYVKTWVLFDKWDLLEYKDAPCDKGKDTLEILMKRKFEVKTNDEVL